MLYKPNFCCQCGDVIERVEWKIWTSRRFCENCETQHFQADWMPRIISVFAIVGGLFGIGSFLKSAEKPLSLTNNQFAVSANNKSATGTKEESLNFEKNQTRLINQNTTSNIASQKNQALLSNSSQTLTKNSPPQNLQNQAEAPVYYCGAQTKKGTPCTRKVKGEGRCWQHTGLPALLPKEKLRVG
jgi:hypothetical protein